MLNYNIPAAFQAENISLSIARYCSSFCGSPSA